MKLARNNDNLPKIFQDKVDLNSTVGMNGSHLPESIPVIDKSSQDIVYQNKNGSLIRLGPDRPGNRMSGYGGAGHTKTATIDIVVGMQSKNNSREINANVFCNPDMSADSARIYLSQKTDVDKNFGLVDGIVGSPQGLSAFAVKADSCRMISRYGIKLVTSTDDQDSLGNNIVGVKGIELIAGNADGTYKPAGFHEEIKYLQPIPKGDNLVRYLRDLSERVDKLSSLVDDFIKIQSSYNRTFANHFHTTVPPTPFNPGIATPSPVLSVVNGTLSPMMSSFVKSGNYQNRTNISTMNSNYLDEEGPLYINSKHNRTT